MDETSNPLIPLGEDGDTIPHAGEQPVLSSLSSEIATASDSNDSLSPDTGQGQSGNHLAEEIQPRVL